jgi:hypothetical protein
MRRNLVVATAALIASVAVAGLPGPAGLGTTGTSGDQQPAAFTSIVISGDSAVPGSPGPLDGALRSAGFLDVEGALVEPGAAPTGPTKRPTVNQPSTSAGSAWKPPLYSMSGWATFYDNGTTAMRLPRGTVVRICGRGGCILRTVNDYGPQKPLRIVDLYRPDFFDICGCPGWSGTTWVTVSVY